MTGLSAEFIMLHDDRKPHCDSRTYSTRKQREERLEQVEFHHYAGDTDSKVLLGNWNHFSRDVGDLLENAGYELEWSDEWSTCVDCCGLIRVSPDSYSFQPAYVIYNDCEEVCHQCVDWEDYLEHIEDNPLKAVGSECDPSDHGYQKLSGDYESGFHPGQNDNPQDILKELHRTGHERIVFRVSGIGQFDVSFESWEKIQEEN